MMSEENLPRGYITVNEAAELAGITSPFRLRAFRRKLQALQEEHGSVLFRFTEARNAPLFTTWPVLRREFPGVFGEPAESNGLDVLELRGMVIALSKRVDNLERKVSSK